MSTPTPRTDAVYLQRGNWANEEELRDLARKLETELAALTAKRDAAIARAERAEDNLAALEQCHDDNCREVVKIAD